jgi:hypothetical protein
LFIGSDKINHDQSRIVVEKELKDIETEIARLEKLKASELWLTDLESV